MSVSHKNLTVLNGMYTNNLDGGVIIAHPFIQNFHLKQNSSTGRLYQSLLIDASFSIFLPNIHATCKNIKRLITEKLTWKLHILTYFKIFDIMYIFKKI
jgi:hypothetical protein